MLKARILSLLGIVLGLLALDAGGAFGGSLVLLAGACVALGFAGARS